MSEITGDPIIDQAIRDIESTFGHIVSVLSKRKGLRKFGRNNAAGTTRTTIMQFAGPETSEELQSGNTITHVVCDDPLFTGQISLEGHYFDEEGRLKFHPQTIGLDGTTPVELDQPLRDCTRSGHPMTELARLAADKKAYVYRGGAVTNGVPDDTSAVHLLHTQEFGQSQKCATATSDEDYWIITEVYGGILRKTAAYADIEMRYAPVGAAELATKFEFPVYSQGNPFQPFPLQNAIIVPNRHDWAMTSNCSTGGCEVVAGAAGVLAKIIKTVS